MEHAPWKYRVLLYKRAVPEEFEWSATEVYGFLATHLSSEAAAADTLAEVKKKGTATRTIEYALGNTAKIVVSLK